MEDNNILEELLHSCQYIRNCNLCDYHIYDDMACEDCPLGKAIAKLQLPTEANIELSELDCTLNDEEEIKDAVVEFLSDNFGFCLFGCEIDLSDEGLAHVTNIEWDTEA